MNTQPRNPLDKEKWLQGNRSRFTMIFLAVMLVIMTCEVKFSLSSAPYLSFLGMLCSFYLGGATLSAWVSANKTETKSVSLDSNETKKVDVTVMENIKIQGKGNAPERKPFAMEALEEGESNGSR